ncbi:MAG: serine--tRNA ligase [Chitinophagaceae bacterium]|jgi:seryl-tRNA synthetase|nr:serine--tRNA ligase [Chitinophagaceae bacterium]MCF8289091.1 serine--tRNA ligase [Chitinophagaceae bacterium]MCF8422596.1 serine--tRNA ligase [Chitinophagaceae bacterium]
MLQVTYLRQHTQLAKDLLAVKHFSNLDLVDQVIAMDDQRKRVQASFDDLQSKVNAASKEIGNHMAKGEKEQAEAIKQNVGAWKLALEPLKVEMAEVELAVQNLVVQLPNLPHALVPKGKTPEENEVVKEAGTTPVLPAGAMAHWDLIKKYNLVDFETGAKITGSGFPLYIGKGAKFQRALTQYFLDFNTAAGYTEYIPPYMVNAASAFATGQLPDKEGQMYHATEDDFYLIPTAEVPVTNVYRDTILKDTDLPIKMTAYSPCFRREAGSFGKEVRGLNRVHQFEKVEIIQIVHPDKSDDTLNEMVAHVENLLISLGLQYRILRLCGGDMGFAAAITYDFEVYSAAQEKWLEVSSVSNFNNYQTYRMKCRFKDQEGKTQFAHSLNGSSLALPRIYAAIVENYQTEAGINLPEVLVPYFGAKQLI